MQRSTAVKTLTGVAGTALAVVAWEAQRRADRRKIEEDPDHDFLFTRLDGRPERVAAADGTGLHAEVYGPEDAPTVVLVHGWTCTSQFWKHQIRDLSGEFRVVAYDQRGHGKSEAAASGEYGIDAFGDDLEAVLERFVPDGQRAVVAGHSLGGMTIVDWAGRHAERVADRIAAAGLVNTGMGDLVIETLVLRTPGPVGMRKAVGRAFLSASAPMPKEPTPLTMRAIHYAALGPAASPAAVAFTEQMVLEAPRRARAGVGKMLSELDLYESIASLTVPTLVIAGERDRLSPLSHSHRLAETLPDLIELVELPGSGHMSPLEEPREVSRLLGDLARRLL